MRCTRGECEACFVRSGKWGQGLPFINYDTQLRWTIEFLQNISPPVSVMEEKITEKRDLGVGLRGMGVKKREIAARE